MRGWKWLFSLAAGDCDLTPQCNPLMGLDRGGQEQPGPSNSFGERLSGHRGALGDLLGGLVSKDEAIKTNSRHGEAGDD